MTIQTVGRVTTFKRGGRPRKTTKNLARRIKRLIINDPGMSSTQILAAVGDVNVSFRTIQLV